LAPRPAAAFGAAFALFLLPGGLPRLRGVASPAAAAFDALFGAAFGAAFALFLLPGGLPRLRPVPPCGVSPAAFAAALPPFLRAMQNSS
jgi:hypothetical protein